MEELERLADAGSLGGEPIDDLIDRAFDRLNDFPEHEVPELRDYARRFIFVVMCDCLAGKRPEAVLRMRCLGTIDAFDSLQETLDDMDASERRKRLAELEAEYDFVGQGRALRRWEKVYGIRPEDGGHFALDDI